MQITTGLVGNLTADPELRYTPAGHAVVNMRVAVSDRVTDRTTGEWKDTPPTFINVTAWRRLAENTAESLHKGDQVVVIGRLTQHDYQTEQGEQRTTHQVEATAVGTGLAHATTTSTRNTKTDG